MVNKGDSRLAVCQAAVDATAGGDLFSPPFPGSYNSSTVKLTHCFSNYRGPDVFPGNPLTGVLVSGGFMPDGLYAP